MNDYMSHEGDGASRYPSPVLGMSPGMVYGSFREYSDPGLGVPASGGDVYTRTRMELDIGVRLAVADGEHEDADSLRKELEGLRFYDITPYREHGPEEDAYIGHLVSRAMDPGGSGVERDSFANEYTMDSGIKDLRIKELIGEIGEN